MTKKWFIFAFIAMFFASLAFNACKDDKKDKDDDPEIPEVDPNDPSRIAEDNLIAYFAFEGDGKDVISAMMPSNTATTTVTFPEGRRGKCFQGTDDGLKSGLLYALPEGSKLKDLKAFSVAFWSLMAPNTIETTNAPEQMVFQIDAIDGDWVWGNLYFLQKRNFPEQENSDFRDYGEMVSAFFKYDDAVAWQGQTANGWFLDVTATQWRHIICTYDNVSSEFHAYVNGVHITAFDGTPYMGVNRKQSEDGPALGDLKFKNAQNFVIGAWAERLKGASLTEDVWAAPYRGKLDELRIYDRGLTTEEVTALYQAEIKYINK